MQQAVWEERRVRMAYRRADGQWLNRLIAPVGLVAKAGIWYVVAGAGERHWVYRISRIMEADLTESGFERPSTFNLADYWTNWCRRFERGL
jgi:predicted DNA-binding transcriptional regulator YafY